MSACAGPFGHLEAFRSLVPACRELFSGGFSELRDFDSNKPTGLVNPHIVPALAASQPRRCEP